MKALFLVGILGLVGASGFYGYHAFVDEPEPPKKQISFSKVKKIEKVDISLKVIAENCHDKDLYSQMKKRLLYLYQIELEDVRLVLRQRFPLETLQIEHEFGYLLHRMRRTCTKKDRKRIAELRTRFLELMRNLPESNEVRM